MAERSLKRSRQVSTDDSDSEGTDDWSPQNSGLNAARRLSPLVDDATSRSRRRAAAPTQKSDSSSKRPIRLTVKAPPSRLRQVMDAEPARESLSRSTKNKRAVYQEPSEDEDEEDDEDDEGVDEEEADAQGQEEEDEEEDAEEEEQEQEQEEQEEDEDEEMEEESAEEASEQAQAEDDEEEDDEEEDEEDEEMQDASADPPRPSIRLRAPTMTDRDRQRVHERALSPRRKLAREGKLKSVEEKEIQMAGSGVGNSEDEDLSDADSDEASDDGSEELDDENLPNDALDTIRASAIGDDELSDDELSDSRAGTPDPSKLTRRQRGIDDTSLMALSNEAQKKKVFTAQEITMRRAEMARRRKDLSEKRNEEEKADTLNRLLHKQAPKRRTRAQIMADAEREEFGISSYEDGGFPKAKPMYVRSVMAVDGTRVGVPDEWLGKPVGRVFEGAVKEPKKMPIPSGTRMVQVIE